MRGGLQLHYLCGFAFRNGRMGVGFAEAAVLSAIVFLALCCNGGTANSTTFTFVNKCSHAVWPGIQPTAGHPVLARGGMCLLPYNAKSISAPSGWSGRFWGRHGCTFDADGKGSCATGDCGGFFCSGAGGAPPATLVEITLGDQDFYDVSLVDGYNLPVSICPRGGSGKCGFAGCVNDLNESCPPGLQVKRDGRVVACKSACYAFSSPEYCCTGTYGNPNTCRPTAYSRLFKTVCPTAYSYAFDDASSLLTCSGADYVITFCPH